MKEDMKFLIIMCCLCLVFHFILLQAVANESGINFISVKGPELLNMVSLNGFTSQSTFCDKTAYRLEK